MSSTQHRGLIAFDGAAKVEIPSSGELPKRLVVAPWGESSTSKGRVVINETTAKELPGNQARSNFDRVALDFNHNTVPGSETYSGEPAKIAAMGTPGVAPNEGIFLDNLEWTPEGREYASGRHYIDLSPTLQFSPNDEAIFIHSAALCRQGSIPGLSLFAADPLTESAISRSDEARRLLCGLLGLPDNTTLDELIAELRRPEPQYDSTERLTDLLSGKNGLSDDMVRVLDAVLEPNKKDELVESVILKNMGISKERAAKYYLEDPQPSNQ